ncbi:glycoside hydrolase family 36 protein [Micromonospora cremea]|uniref:Alpha-galactosidase n=1 Tax=Micromonospora cremea TaxID=709881 RepID=A0A1N5UGR0_9ACTN|nr:glycoside hydrolase family 36 protein [Micromonospora cremea]SIM59830.1 alpha-galactosidase [Micromonospora cremea]
MISSEPVTSLVWGHSALRLVVDVSPDGPVAISSLSDGVRQSQSPATQPLVELLVAGEGRARASHRFSETAIGRRLAYVGSSQARDGAWCELRVDLRDERTGLTIETLFRSAEGVSACQVRTRVTNQGAAPVLLLGVTSFATGIGGYPVDELDVIRADSEWLGESRWTRQRLRDDVPDLNLPLHGQDGRGRLAVVSRGTWSTGTHLPTGGIIHRGGGPAWLWQVEHNGAWRWEVGERLDGSYLALLGPTDIDHQWQHRVAPGESFTTVPVSVAVSADGLDGAVAALTAHRRALVRPHRDRSALPVVFNDYMNTLMGDPTTAKLLPLIDAAADAGAEVFCIDAGWYDNGTAWWDSVGEWQPSQTRFPRGIEEVLARIRHRKMVPGLWLEPEVIGVRSPMADKLPKQAFLQRGGVRLVEHGRYHLDLRHPRAVAHLDEVVDRLVEQLGVGYLKLDYNIDPGPGTDLDADSVGAGLLGHNRAHLAWLDRLLDRHPDLILENCASGAMRMDYALLSRMQLQSTSDQQDYLRYPPVAVAAPMSVLPEQSASWAYPQPDMSGEQLAYTMCTGFLGRLYLSGRLDGMDADQTESVRAAVQVHREIRGDLAAAVPLWPLGLPGWDDPWLSLALRAGDVVYLAVWRRAGGTPATTLSLPHLRGRDVEIDLLYPRRLPAWRCDWAAGTGSLTVSPNRPEPAAARLFRIVPTT